MADQYIKMVLALPEELFKRWKWKEGDTFLYKEDESETYSIGYIGTHILSNTKPVGFMDICFDPFEHLMNLRPLPSQEQLQNMCLEKEEPFDPEILYVFTDWVYSTLRSVKFSSLESAWLQYVMWVIYKKEWDGEKWI